MNDDTRKALEGLQAALGLSGALPDDPVEALIALAAEADPIARRVFDGDPYASLVLALAPGPAELEVASRVAGLVPFETDWWQHRTHYVDRVADPEGRHRVYVRDEEALPGLPWQSLPSIAALAEGWAQAAQGDTEVEWAQLEEDDWEAGPTSGSFVLETMLHASLSSQWALAGIGAFLPSRPELGEEPLPVDPDASGRVICLHALRVVRLAGQLTLPEGLDVADLDPEHRAYLEHLGELEGAFAGVEPPMVKAVAAEPGPLRKSARAWLESFAEASELEQPQPTLDPELLEEPPPAPLTTFEKRLRASVDEALDDLIDAGEVEVLQREMLLDELTRVAEEARSPKHLLKKLVKTLVESEAVDEIYATDDELSDAFGKRLGKD